MSDVASLELCKELYKLSRWTDTDDRWDAKKSWPIALPKYTLGYLLRKLPPSLKHNDFPYILGIHPNYSGSSWSAAYSDPEQNVAYIQLFADTPENTTCKLAIELFKQGVLSTQTPSTEREKADEL